MLLSCPGSALPRDTTTLVAEDEEFLFVNWCGYGGTFVVINTPGFRGI